MNLFRINSGLLKNNCKDIRVIQSKEIIRMDLRLVEQHKELRQFKSKSTVET